MKDFARRARGDVFASKFFPLITRREAPNKHKRLAKSYYQILYHPQNDKRIIKNFYKKANFSKKIFLYDFRVKIIYFLYIFQNMIFYTFHTFKNYNDFKAKIRQMAEYNGMNIIEYEA